MAYISNKRISAYLDEQGIPHHVVAYRYLMHIIRAIIDGKVDRYQLKETYRYVANIENIHAKTVECAIRRTLSQHGSADQPIMTNGKFIYKTVDTLMLEADENWIPPVAR